RQIETLDVLELVELGQVTLVDSALSPELGEVRVGVGDLGRAHASLEDLERVVARVVERCDPALRRHRSPLRTPASSLTRMSCFTIPAVETVDLEPSRRDPQQRWWDPDVQTMAPDQLHELREVRLRDMIWRVFERPVP